MTVRIEEIVDLLEGRLKELRDEAARLESALQALKGEDSVKEKPQPSPKAAPKTRSKGARRGKRGKQVSSKTPRKTVADMIEEIMLTQPQLTWTSPAIASRIGKTPKHVSQVLAKQDRFKFIGRADDRLSKLYMLEAEFKKLPEDVDPYMIPSVQGTAERPSKNGQEKDPVVHSSAEGLGVIQMGGRKG